MHRRRTTAFAALRFGHLDLPSATRALLSPRSLRTPVPWRLVNTYCISLLGRDRAFTAALLGDGVSLADGRPVAWVLRLLSRRAGSRTAPGHVRGADLFTGALDEGRGAGVRHFLLGGTPETLTALQERIAQRFPGALVVGAESPPFRELTADERRAQDARIRASGADIVWVGLGTPRQDVEAARLARSVGRPAVAVGAAFDFVAGTRPEAPRWMRRLALEWLFRFASEPRRLWRRYTVGIVRFAAVAGAELLRRPAATPAVDDSGRAARPAVA